MHHIRIHIRMKNMICKVNFLLFHRTWDFVAISLTKEVFWKDMCPTATQNDELYTIDRALPNIHGGFGVYYIVVVHSVMYKREIKERFVHSYADLRRWPMS